MENQKANYLPSCNYCVGNVQCEWNFVYGELPAMDYAYCCTEHIPEMIASILKGKHGEVKVGYLQKFNALGSYDRMWQEQWARFYRNNMGKPSDSTPVHIKGLNRILSNSDL